MHVRGRSLQNLPDLDKLTKLQELLSEGCERLDVHHYVREEPAVSYR